MRPTLAIAAVAFAAAGAAPAAIVLALSGAAHMARSPDRLLDGLYALAFIGLGVVAGR